MKDLGEPPVRKLCKEQASSSLDSLFYEIAGEQESTSPSLAPVGAAIQLETYLGEPKTIATDLQLERQRTFFLSKRTCPSLAQNKFNHHREMLWCHVDHLRYSATVLCCILNEYFEVKYVAKRLKTQRQKVTILHSGFLVICVAVSCLKHFVKF